MTTAARASGVGGLLRRILAVPTAEYPLVSEPLPIQTLSPAPELSFFLGRPEDGADTLGYTPASSSVAIGDEVMPGHVLGSAGDRGMRPSPVAGKVTAVRSTPDVRGGKPGLAVVIEVGAAAAAPAGAAEGAASAASDAAPAFPPLDPNSASDTALRNRIREAGVLTGALAPSPLVEAITAADDDTLVVVAIDREPGLSATLACWADRRTDSARAARMLARAAGARRAVLAVPTSHAPAAADACAPEKVEVLAIPPEYPESLQPLVALRAGAPNALVVPLHAALGAFDAVASGKVQSHKVVTIVGREGAPLGNYRVALGTSLSHIFSELGLVPEDHDKIVAGGMMRGFAQYSLDAVLDPTVDGLLLVPDNAFPNWSDEPCISCGACIDVCPIDLQVHKIGRYAEFGLFDRTPEFGIEHCVECGLCATVCVARRPLLQLIRLAKSELPAPAAALACPAPDAPEAPEAPAATEASS